MHVLALAGYLVRLPHLAVEYFLGDRDKTRMRDPSTVMPVAGLRQNLNVGIGYIEAWLRGIGCVPLYHLMEDAATAEISRAQVWQWIRHGAKLDDGRAVDAALCHKVLDEELTTLRETTQGSGRYEDAAKLFSELIDAPTFPEFLTSPAYDLITAGLV